MSGIKISIIGLFEQSLGAQGFKVKMKALLIKKGIDINFYLDR